MAKQLLLLLWGAWASLLHTLVCFLRPKQLALPPNRSVRRREQNVPGPAQVARGPSKRLGGTQALPITAKDTFKYPFWAEASDATQIASGQQQFHQQFHSLGYDSYGPGLDALRSSQFPQLAGVTYLDHAATTLYAVQQLQSANLELSKHLFANPHSQLGGAVDHTPVAIEELRLLTLQMLNGPAEEYEVVFTAGATAALKLAGETFPWSPGASCCAYTTVNHNSALGIRQLALAAGAIIQSFSVQELLQQQHGRQCSTLTTAQQQLVQQHGDVHNLLIVPAECNFSGTRYHPQAVLKLWQQQQQQRQQRWWLLVDAAKACASHPPDLSDCVIDLLALSYYKIFGHPTGLGALVVRRSLLPLLLLQKAYFGGGTVEVAVAEQPHVVRRQGAAGFEDGTLPFTSIAAARHGFKQILQLNAHNTLNHIMQYSSSSSDGIERSNVSFTSVDQHLPLPPPQQQQVLLRGSFARIDRHMACLTWHLVDQLLQLQHSNGQKAAVLYCQPAIQELFLQWQGADSTLRVESANDNHGGSSSSSSEDGGAGKQQQQQQDSESSINIIDESPNTSTSSSSSSNGLTEPRTSEITQQKQQQQQQKHWTRVPVDEDLLSRFQTLQGPVVCFNLLRPDGSWVGHKEVAKLALIHGICLRTGCFCNPGACAVYLNLTAEDQMAHHAAGHVCWDDHDVINGRPTGAVRASFGYMSSYDDVALLLLFVKKFFVDNDGTSAAAAAAAAVVPPEARSSTDSLQTIQQQQQQQHLSSDAAAHAAATVSSTTFASSTSSAALAGSRVMQGSTSGSALASSTSRPDSTSGLALASSTSRPGSTSGSALASSTSRPGSTSGSALSSSTGRTTAGRLSALYVYPIKSCAPQRVSSWPLGPNGLLFDREWALCDFNGVILTQKRVPSLTQIQPEVDLQAGVLRVTAPCIRQQLVVELEINSGQQQQQQQQPMQPQQHVQICGDTICSQIVVGQVTGMAAAAAAGDDNNHGKQAIQSHAATAAAAAVASAADPPTYDAQAWFTAALGVPCRLVQQLDNSRTLKQQQQQQQQHEQQQQQGVSAAPQQHQVQGSTASPTLGFANEGQYLLVNQASVNVVAQQLAAAAAGAQISSSSKANGVLDALRFRPNLVVEGFAPWAEDSWRDLEFSSSSTSGGGGSRGGSSSSDGGGTSSSSDGGGGSSSSFGSSKSSGRKAGSVVLDVVGACGRCDMIRVDQVTGQRHGGELLSLLARQRRQRGKLNFGVLLAHSKRQVHVTAAAGAADGGDGGSYADGVGCQRLSVGDTVLGVCNKP